MTDFWRQPVLSRFVRRAAQVNGRGKAFEVGGTSTTWSEFEAEVVAIARNLRDLGMTKGARIALASENSHHLLKAWFAGLYAGCSVVPVNTRLSASEIGACLADCEAEAMIISPDQSSRLTREATPDRVRLIIGTENAASMGLEYDLQSLRMRHSAAQLPPEASGDDVAGIFYTGGTTGGPKGVMLSHGNLVANTTNVIGSLGFNSGTKYLHAAPLFHILESAGLFGVTAAAGCHYFVPKFEAGMVADALWESGISAIALVPTMIASLLDKLDELNLSPRLETLFYGGTAMPSALLARLRTRLPHTKLIQGYGQTETSPTITLLLDQDHDPALSRSRSCGIAVPSVEVGLLGPDDEPVEAGAVGEICVRGATVMRGYWKKPVETGDALRNGWLRTGDAGYMDEDGYLFIVDRIKDFIKTGGENVFPTEVENAIYLHPDVLECVVFGVPSERWGEEVVAVVHLKLNSVTSDSALQAHLRGHLGGFKIPKTIEFAGAPLPKSGPGKILRKILKEEHQRKRLTT
jgi:acyl-CoA synthetase (AMP-forming)/AMP-acid ligase II